ncbi:MAG: carboxypeptidase regulatory-like domain-containing protein [Chitinophagaceae bacterium]
MRKLNLKLIYFLLCICYCGRSMAQETTSEIVGIVSDGKTPLSGATVVVNNISTGAKYTTTTRKEGRYNIPNLRVGGPYTVSVSFVGFKEEKQENIFLLLGQESKADFKLSPSATTLENVVVATARQEKVINKNRTGSQEIINRSQIERLPTLNRSLLDFTKLTPSSSGFNIGGRNGFLNTVTVDGANLTNTFGLGSSPALGSQTNSQPISLDAIEQIQVNVSPYDVRQGGFSGAGINSVTRSGTNQFKGTVYTFLRSPDIQGYDVGKVTIPKQDYKYNQRGAAIGGPIIRNKLFFFISGEQERLTQPGTSFIASDASHPAGGAVSQVKADTLAKLSKFLKDNYNYDTGPYQGYSYKTQSDKLTVKLDWNINSNNTFTVKYNYLKSFREIQASNSGSINSVNGRTPGTTAMPFYGSGYAQNNNFKIFIGELNTRLGNKASNKLQVGYSALRDYRALLSPQVFPLVDILNGSGNPFTSFGNEQYSYGNLLSTDIYQISDIFNLYKGSHELSFGTQNYYRKYRNGFSPSYQGVYRFNSLADFYASASGIKAAPRYDLSYAFGKDGSFPFATPSAFELGLFAQDKWRILPNLTVTYGLRVDVPFFQAEFTSNPAVPALSFRNNLHVDVGRKPSTNPLFSPRVGFNWDVNNDQVMQIRGGAGLFAGPPPFVWISNQASNNGVQFGSISAGTTYLFSPDVNKYRPATGSNTAYSINVTDKDFKYPQVLKTTLAIDRKLPGDIILTLEGNYSKDINNVNFENINLPATGTAFAGSDKRIRYSNTKIYAGTGGATLANPNIGNAILMKNYNKGYAYYVTLQAQKTFHNLYLNAAYTYSKSKDLNVGGSTAGTLWGSRPVTGDPNAPELGYSNFYVPHRVIASASYRFEYAKNFATSIGLIFEASASVIPEVTLYASASYVYNGDMNNDGNTSNDLIYIPKDQNDIVLVPVNTNGGVITDTRTTAEIWSQLNNYIDQDKYLSKNRGKVAERNGLIMPFFKKLDLNVTQEFAIKTGKTDVNKHTVRLTFDLINVGNMINKNWSAAKTTNVTNILKYEGIAPAGSADAGKPRYSFPYLDASKLIPLTSTFKDYTGLLSRWQGQIGVRYLFN